MNCAQHPGTAAVSYCCACGRALCELCKHDVQGAIFCEPCLAARIRTPRAPEDASPELALFLGFIPGVGAFYNGQFLKGFVHVLVLCMLIFLSDHGMGALAGLMIAAWFFYMVFDAYTTAKARRYGLPLPDPIGLNAILAGHDGTFGQRVEQAGERVGATVEQAAQNIGQHWRQTGATPDGATSGTPVVPGDAVSGEAAPAQAAPKVEPVANPDAAERASSAASNSGSYRIPDTGRESTASVGAAPGYVPLKEGERSPIGAVLLIGLGVLLLLDNLGWFNFLWIRHYWPVILIAAGLWLFINRQRGAR